MVYNRGCTQKAEEEEKGVIHDRGRLHLLRLCQEAESFSCFFIITCPTCNRSRSLVRRSSRLLTGTEK